MLLNISEVDNHSTFQQFNHSTILQNLINLGFDKVSVKLICSYLCERYQYVKINEKSSSKQLTEIGIP